MGKIIGHGETTMKIGHHSGGVLGVSFTALPGVTPGDFGYFGCLYRNSRLLYCQPPALPSGIDPVAPLTKNGQTQSNVWPIDLGDTTYTVGLGTDNGLIVCHEDNNSKHYDYNYRSLCSSITFPTGDTGEPPRYVTTSLSIDTDQQPQIDSVVFDYTTPEGNSPDGNNNHVFLWESDMPLFRDKSSVVLKEKIRQKNSSGSWYLLHTFSSGVPYCLGYAAGDRLEDVCAYVSFMI